MRFRQYVLLTEADPMGGMGAGNPMGSMGAGSPMGGMGAGPMGGTPPMAGGGMGGDPMAGGMGAPQGAAAGPPEPPVIPRNADVWQVLDSILNHKPLEHDKLFQKQQQEKQQKQAAQPMGDPMAGGAPPMGQSPMMM